ncbi:hypothetical protein [Stutzerimonas nitrititolerans]|uniref:hypothetical protein n=1 Tax=Stutzerimonas nitrititolerans TaxID=2482751 RepID=UPI003AA9A459
MINLESRGPRLFSSIGTERGRCQVSATSLPFFDAILIHEDSAARDGIIPKSLAAGDSSGET